MNANPLVSVIIPSFGRPERVLSAIESVLGQTYPSVEVIVVDDASPAPIAPIIQGRFGAEIVCIRHELNRGAAAARNTGIAHSSGEWIAFLDDDDQWLPTRLERQMAHIQSACNYAPAVAYCWGALMRDSQEVKGRRPSYERGKLKELLASNTIGPTPLVMVHRACLEQVGAFNEQYLTGEDWELWIRCALKFPVWGLREVLVLQQAHGDQLSTSLSKKIQFRSLFLSEYDQLLKQYPSIRSQHYTRAGSLSMLGGHEADAEMFYKKAVQACPWSWRAWRYCLLFLMRSVPVCRSALMRRVKRQASADLSGVTYYN